MMNIRDLVNDIPRLFGTLTSEFVDELRWILAESLLDVKRSDVHEEGKTEVTPPSPELARGTIPFGKAVGSWRRTTLYFPKDDNRHKLIIGPTRSGKTEFAKVLAINIAKAGHGLAFLDNADGEAIDHILDALPEECLPRVRVLDYSDPFYPLPAGIPSQAANVFDQDRTTAWWVAFFQSNFGVEDAYATTELLSYACRAAFSVPGSTLLEVVSMVASPEARAHILSKVMDRDILQWWARFDSRFSDNPSRQFNDPAVAAFLRRAGIIFSQRSLRQIVAQRPSKEIDFRQWIDEGAIILVKVKKSAGSLIVRTVMGLTLLSLWSAVLSRDDLPLHKRTPFYVITDEPQSWLAKNEQVLDDLFSQSAKYGLRLLALFQSLQQIANESRGLVKVMLDNDPDLLLFQNAVEQFPSIKKFPPVPRYHFIAKVSDNAPFVASSLGRLETVADRSHLAKEHRQRFGASSRSVLDDIERRMTSWSSVQTYESPENGLIPSAGLALQREIKASSNSSLRIG